MAGFVLPIISGLAGLLGGGQQQQQQQNSQGTQSTTGQSFSGSTVTPQLSGFQNALAGLFTQQAANLANQSTNLGPYTTSGLSAIQGQGQGNNQTLSNIIASRGLGYSPAAASVLGANTINTGNQANSFLASIPLLQRQLQQQSLQGLLSAFQVLPTGQSSTGSSSQFGNTQSQQTGNASLFGNPAAGAVSGFGAGLASPTLPNTYLSSILNLFAPKGVQGPGSIPGGSLTQYGQTGFGG